MLPARILGKAIEIQKLVVEHDARVRLRLYDRVQRVSENHDSRRVGIVAVQHQHALWLFCVLCPTRRWRRKQHHEPGRASDGTRFHGDPDSRRCALWRARTS